MTVDEVVTQLKYGELRSLAAREDIPAMVSYMNLALIALYGRFKLLRSEQIIDLQDNIATYNLASDVLSIEAVYTEVAEIGVNDDNALNGVFTPSFDTIQLPNAKTGNQLSVLYVATPAKLLVDATDSVTLAQNVRLPEQLMEPFLHYIGYRAHGSMNGDIKAENNTHYMRYEASCKRVLDLGLIRVDAVPAFVNRQEGISDAED
jgi:hypothetical protein